MNKLQLIRKPDRDWNHLDQATDDDLDEGYNSLENPIGIETQPRPAKRLRAGVTTH